MDKKIIEGEKSGEVTLVVPFGEISDLFISVNGCHSQTYAEKK
jgi:hypothetical protein